MIDAIAATGDAGDINCWSGIPWHFGQSLNEAGALATPWRLPMESFAGPRRWWNFTRLVSGRGTGGYQYSAAFLDRAEAAIPGELWTGRVLTFNQHFPRTTSVRNRGGRLVHYIDATFGSFCEQEGWARELPEKVRLEARALECLNYQASEWVVTMGRWAAAKVIQQCGVPEGKVTTILPGANVELPPAYDFPVPPGRPGRDRPLVLGFVGKDWKRKGLPFLLAVRTALTRQGVKSVVRAAGCCPKELQGEAGVEYVGFIDKAREPRRFVGFLAGCDVGCLFSEHEPLGISTLEFLRAGVPVTGFMIEGVADTVPPDAGFRFPAGASAEVVAQELAQAFHDEAGIARLRAAARAWSPLVTWQRCAREWQELLANGFVAAPVQPWRILEAHQNKLHAIHNDCR